MTSIDKFGRRPKIVEARPSLGFQRTIDGHLTLHNRRLKNVGEPIDSRDAVTQNYVTNIKNDTIKLMEDRVDTISKQWFDAFLKLDSPMKKIHTRIEVLEKVLDDLAGKVDKQLKVIEDGGRHILEKRIKTQDKHLNKGLETPTNHHQE